MTHSGAIHAFAESLEQVEAPRAGIGAVLLADQLVLGRSSQPTADARSGVDIERAAAAGLRGSADDADDVHWGALVHPGAIIWPVSLEVGRARGATGLEIARAASVGYEAMVRLATGIGPLAGFHLTSVVGATGAAASASALLDDTVSAAALGHALSVAGGSVGAFLERSGTRSFHRGHAVRTGLAAALAASGGLGATQGDLERGGGVLPDPTTWNPAALVVFTDALGSTSLRPLPTSGWNHPAYEAARDAARDGSGAITRIIVEVPESTRRASAGTFEPATEAWHHLGHSVARAIVSVRDGQDAAALTRLVEILERADPGALVRIESEHGGASAEVLLPLGHPTRHPSTDDLALKWRIEPGRAAAFVEEVADWLVSTTTSPPPSPPEPINQKEP